MGIQRKKILLFPEGASMAHPTRMSVLADLIDPSIFEIHFACPEEYVSFISFRNREAKIYPFQSITTETFNERMYLGQFYMNLAEQDQAVREDARLIDAIRPDVVLSDFRLSLPVTTQKQKIPLICLLQYHWSPFYQRPLVTPCVKPVAIFGRTFCEVFNPIITPIMMRRYLKQVHAFEKKYDLHLSQDLSEFYTRGDYVLFPDLKEIFVSQFSSDQNSFLGPIFWKPENMSWPPHWPEPERFTNEKMAYVTMGSTGSSQVLPIVVEKLIQLGFKIFLSAKDESYSARYPERIWQSSFVPADLVLQKSSLLICNGGTSTTYHAMSHGVPVLGVTFNMDQCLHMDRLQKEDAAEFIYSDQVRTNLFEEKIATLMNSESRRKKRLSIKNKIQENQLAPKLNKVLKKFI